MYSRYMEEKSRVFSRDEIAKQLKISIRKTDELILSKQLPSFKVGKCRRVTEAALAAFIRKLESAAK